MVVNVEALTIAHLNATADLPEAFMDIPADRPASFITVERTSGERNTFRDLPVLAVQCWHETRYQASELAGLVGDRLERLIDHPQVGRVVVNSAYNFPDPESGQARYQLVAEIVTKQQ